MSTWQLKEAKRNLSKVIKLALEQEPQTITRRGEKVAIVISYNEYLRAIKPQIKLSEFFRKSPLAKTDIDLSHEKSLPRETGKWLGL
ncbi:MAG: type II toxin-antitoxin system Phd/YefM family antitoxin [Chloroflexota bacterium]